MSLLIIFVDICCFVNFNQKRGGTALDEPWSNRLKSFFRASPTPAFNRLSYVRQSAVLPPYKNALRLQK
jgi:hypothetical protein